ncbi:MAG: hypothetical protein ACYSWO_16920 [Planctomycetota bacterium]
MKAALGICARLTPTIENEFTGARIKDNRTLGTICVPVLISQAAFITDHVHMIAAIIMAVRRSHFRGQAEQNSDRRASMANRHAMSARIQPRYSSAIAVYRRE